MSDRQEWVSSWAPLCPGNVCFPTPGHIPRVWLRIPIKIQRARKRKIIKTSYHILLVFLKEKLKKNQQRIKKHIMALMDQPLQLWLRNVCPLLVQKNIYILLNRPPARDRPRRNNLDLQKLCRTIPSSFARVRSGGDLAPIECLYLKGGVRYNRIFGSFSFVQKKRGHTKALVSQDWRYSRAILQTKKSFQLTILQLMQIRKGFPIKRH